MARLIGVDLGTRRIGIALSDSDETVATPYLALPRTSDEQDTRAIAEISRAEKARTVVLGYPITLAGHVEDAARMVESFAAKLREAGMRVRLWDERLTTAEAEKRLREAGVKGKRRRSMIDKAAAAIMLQAYLDSKK
jgi:putative Holliday junction resolvase